MADGVVSFLVQNLSRLLDDELNLFSGVEGKIKSLCNELKFIEVFLKSSEGKRSDEVVKQVVSQIRDVAHKAEDVVDAYFANITRNKRRNKLSKLFHFKERYVVLHEVNAEIEKIKSCIDEIYKNKERYGIGEGEFQSEEATVAESLRKRRRDVEEEDVVSLVHDSSVVIQQLKETDSRLKVASIIGMGGLGKTTLARKIYNNSEVKELFPSRAWGYVSNDYRPKEFMLSLLKCLLSPSAYNNLFKKTTDGDEYLSHLFKKTTDGSEYLSQEELKKKVKTMPGGEDVSEEELKKKLAEHLKGKKYLVVLDDIWETQVWDEVKCSFPDDQNGSRILITSRINEVAHYTGTESPYNLPFLNKDESWELFSKKVFRGAQCPSDLESLGRSIAETCGGLPLAIVVLAGLVAKKEKSQREWSRIMEVSWHLTHDKTEVMDTLKLSYNNLPRRLKPCFLCFGIYPEDYEISARQLIQLWIAEGFIQPQETGISNTTELEDVAEYYLDELVDRSLVQVAKRRSDAGVKTCRIHDLLRDLCISESKSDKFLEVCTESNIGIVSNTNPRRLSFHCKPHPYISANTFDKSCTRSMFIFTGDSMPLDYISKSFKLARVLHFEPHEPVLCYSLPNNFKRMIHLRYLRISVANKLPACVCSLWNLETLHVTYETTVPREIWMLKRLRHLYLIGGQKLPVLPKANRMENLQTLWLSTKDPQIISLVNNDIFPRLRKLALHYSLRLGVIPRLPSVQHLSNLHSLKIIDRVKLPSDANEFPSNLTKLTLVIIDWNPLYFMKTLGRLDNLQILKLIAQDSDVLFNFDFVKTCGGLPLAIVVLAGLVAKKEKSQREWSRIKELSWHLTEDKTEVMDILKLSYDSLPGELKPCFLYFGIYPEDYEISARDLIKLWIAEGFVQPQETAEVEDIAEYYLDELVDRSLVQVAERRSDGGVKTCRIHDLIRDLCISESKSDKFLEVCTDSNIDSVINTNPRRLSILCKPFSLVSANTFHKSCTRSIFIFDGGRMDLFHVSKNFELARVLGCDMIQRVWSNSVSRDFKRMIHLRYLKLTDCVCSLWNLETLHVFYQKTVSSKIWTLKRLRHLYLIGGEKLPVVLPKANRIENLQSLGLSTEKYPQQINSLLNSGIFPRLRKLTLHCPEATAESGMLSSIRHLSNLHSLKIIGNLKLPSDTNAFPSNLTKITFNPDAFRDPHSLMKTLGRLTNLQILKLTLPGYNLQSRRHISNSDVLFNFDFGRGEFPQLQVFHMRGIKVRQWRLEKDAMPRLHHLVINKCFGLPELPEQLWSLTTLRLLHVLSPSKELANSLQNMEPRNGCKLIISPSS